MSEQGKLFEKFYNNGYDVFGVINFLKDHEGISNGDLFRMGNMLEVFIYRSIPKHFNEVSRRLKLEDAIQTLENDLETCSTIANPIYVKQNLRTLVIDVQGRLLKMLESNSIDLNESERELNNPQLAKLLDVLKNRNLITDNNSAIKRGVDELVSKAGEGVRKRLSNPDNLSAKDFDELITMVGRVHKDLIDDRKKMFPE